jgi:DNA-binding beta-propeller fold protein YncE
VASPDDLIQTAGGPVWVSSSEGGTLTELELDGRVLRRISDGNAPEGLVVLADGHLRVAEQGVNRIDDLAPDGTLTPVIQLTNRTANAGVDGLGLDNDGRLLVPDSPNGTVLSYPAGGGTPQVLASGLGRPVAAARTPLGVLYVAVENSPGLVRIDAGGGSTGVGSNGQLDEVIVSRGLLYVGDLTRHELRAVDPATGAARVLVTGSPQLQGLIALADGRLLLADTTAGVVTPVDPCR